MRPRYTRKNGRGREEGEGGGGEVNGVFRESKPGRSVGRGEGGGASHTRHLCENKRGHPRRLVAPFLSCAPRP